MHLLYKSILLSTLFLMLTSALHAQKAISIGDIVIPDNNISAEDMRRVSDEVIVSDTLLGWNFNWLAEVKGAQSAYSNWSNGGVNTISATGTSIFNAMYRQGLFAYALNTDLRFGKSYIAGQGTRKINDRIAINNKISHLFGADSLWSVFANLNFSTQFAQGFEYIDEEGVEPILISEFFSPAYFTQIVGVGYLPTSYLVFTAGFALKETIVLNDSLSTVYGLPAGENFRFEPGYSLGIKFEKAIMENVRIVSSLETFTNLHRPLNRTDVFFSNEVIGEINDFLSMSFQFLAIYDDDFSKQLQIKQVLSAGLSFTLL